MSPRTHQAIQEHHVSEAWRTAIPKRRRGGGFLRTWFKLRLIGFVIAVAFGGFASLKDKYFADSATPDAPSEWSADVAPIAAFVESERGLAFDHPVAIDFLEEQEYIEYLGAESYEPTTEEIEEFANMSAVYDAAGLAVELDLLDAWSTVSSVGTLGVYLPAEDRIVIRGAEMTPAVRVVLAHELTHALQAQHFDLTLGGPDDLSVRSIVEADALRVEDVYLATLTSAERELALEQLAGDESSTAALSSVPAVITETFAAPYVLGPLLVEEAFARDGNEGVNRLLRRPPTEEILINPHLFDTPQTDAEPLVTVPPGATVIEDVEQLSMLDTLTMLDAWLPWTQARGALDGWGGGGYVSYVRSDGIVCFAINAAFDGSTQPFEEAVRAWAQATGSTAAPTTTGGRVTFEACERGPGALAPPVPVVSLTNALYLEDSIIGSAPPPEEIGGRRCFARTMIDDPQVAPLLIKAELTLEEENVITWVSDVAADACAIELP